MTTFTGSVHRDNWGRFLDIALPMLLEPGLREEDFRRVKDAQMNALKQDLRNNNEEELGKERLQVNDLRGHALRPPRAGDGGRHRGHHPRRRAGVPQGPLHPGQPHGGPGGRRPRGDAGPAAGRSLAALPEGPAPAAPAGVAGRSPKGIEVEIVEKDTRATAISFGHPIAVTRSHPDFAALWLARAWLGEHRVVGLAPLRAHPRGPRDELRRLRLHRGLPARDVPVLPRPQHRPPRPDLRGLDPAGGAGERPHGPAHRRPRAAQDDRRRPLRRGLRGHAQLPHEERLPDDGHARTTSSATRSTRSGTASASSRRSCAIACPS